MRGYVDTRWGQLHYSRVGSGDQTVALFHETPLNHEAFAGLVALLAPDFQVIAFDTPGYGESDPPPELTSMQEYAATVAEGIVALDLTHLVLYGVHTGASIAFALAALVPDRVDGLAVSGLPFYEDDVRAARRVPPVPEPDDAGGHLLAVFNWEPAIYEVGVRSRLVSGVYKHPAWAYSAFHAVYLFQPSTIVDQVVCPVLALSHKGDPVFSGDARLLREIPRSRQVVVEADRLPLYRSRTEVVADHLRAFALASAT